VTWEVQKAAGATKPPEFFLPRAALHRGAAPVPRTPDLR
jgi:hypothetical protein